MPEVFPDEMPPEIESLFARARAGAITEADFMSALDKQGIDEMAKVLYMGRAFGLSLRRAKEVAHLSDDAWVNALCDAVDDNDELLAEASNAEEPTAKAS